jgi:ferrous iron transport protein A
MTLADTNVGFETTVVGVTVEGPLGDRLMEMGLTPGAPIRVVRGGDPLQIVIRDYRLSLRRLDAAGIRVNP